jgi:hypothetical protein
MLTLYWETARPTKMKTIWMLKVRLNHAALRFIIVIKKQVNMAQVPAQGSEYGELEASLSDEPEAHMSRSVLCRTQWLDPY